MKTTIEYFCTQRFEDSFEVESVGNVALVTYNDNGLKWFFNIETINGFSTIKSFGPIDIQTELPYEGSFYFSKIKMEYNDKKLEKKISEFVNATNKEITQVIPIDKEEFNKNLKKIIL